MNNTTLRLYTLNYRQARTYMVALLFITANIIFPQLLHIVPRGGVTWLPIYFFTLIGAYKYGWKAGLLTALLSPAVNSLLFGMPAVAALPAITLKSALLALAAGFAAARFKKVTILLITAVVLAYQSVGTLGEWAMCGDFFAAVQDFRIGIPGMLLQIFGGWFIIKLIRK